MKNEMTAEEAKSILETMYYELSNQLGSDWCRNKYKAIGKAIQALEVQRNLTNEELYQSFIELEAENERLHDALEAQPTEMRDATEEERKSVKDYIESISKPTGVRFDAQPTDAKETIIKSALKYLVKKQIEEGSVGFAVDNDHDHDCCWDDVLAWLEAQPSEDCISRKQALDDKGLAVFHRYDDYVKMRNYLKSLPFVKPKYTDEEIDKAQAVEQAYVDKMVELAVEETKRPKGEWRRVVDKAGHWVWECDCKWQQRFATNFCPDCGADMRGKEDED